MQKNLVSIVIPYFNHKFFIEELLESIRNQNYKKIETILIDDGSTDGSNKILKSLQKKYNFLLVTQKNCGVCSALNVGINLAKGEFIKPIASDDILLQNQIKDQVDTIKKTSHDVIAGGVTLIKKNSKVLNYLKPRKLGKILFEDIIFNNPVYAPSIFFRASSFVKYGKFEEHNPIDDFSILLQMASQNAAIYNYNKNWAFYRVSEKNYLKKAKWYLEGVLITLSSYSQNSIIKRAINYHNFIYILKTSLFIGYTKKNSFIKIFENDEIFLNKIIKYLIIILAAFLPNFIRQIIQKKIIYKSAKMLSISNLFN